MTINKEAYLKARIEALTESSGKLWREIAELNSALEQLQRERILSNGILQTMHWRLDELGNGKWLYLRAETGAYKPDEIFELFSGEHASFRLVGDELQLFADDGDLSMRVKDIPTLLKYRRELKLLIDFSGIEEKLEEYRARWAVTKELYDEVREWQ